jgi:hypothetical protein
MLFQLDPLPQLQVLDHYTRRDPSSALAIGALLGTSTKSTTTIKSSFAVSTTMEEGNLVLPVEEFIQSMALYRRSNPKERIVGWFDFPF